MILTPIKTLVTFRSEKCNRNFYEISITFYSGKNIWSEIVPHLNIRNIEI